MEDQIPNSLSASDLEGLLSKAAPDVDYTEEKEFAGLTKSELIEHVRATRKLLHEKAPCPMATKIMALMMLVDLENYHEGIADKAAEHREPESAFIWARDSGIIKAAHSLLMGVSVDNTDFIADEVNGISSNND